MNQPCTEQAIRDNEQLAELDVMYKETERALVLIGDRMREIKNRLQKKPPVRSMALIRYDAEHLMAYRTYTKLAGGKYEK